MKNAKQESSQPPMGDSALIINALRLHLGGDAVDSLARIRGVEIGVHRGGLSAELLRAFPNLFLYLIDPWQVYEDRHHPYRKSRDKCSRFTAEQQENNYRTAVAVTAEFADRRGILRMTSLEAAASGLIEDGSLDFVFVDGDHSYEAVKADIAAWWPKVRRGGVLSGHDFGHRRDRIGLWGVQKGVTEFAEREGLKIEVNGSVWSCVKP